MDQIRKNDWGFTGLEAAIVLIAFVVIAAVFAYVVLGAGFFTTQKSQETVYKGVEQASSNIQMLGQVYGIRSGASANKINLIEFSLGLAPGAPAIDLDAMTIVYSAPNVDPITYSLGTAAADNHYFSATDKSGATTTSLSTGDQVRIDLFTGSAGERGKGDKINIEIRPGVGAVLPYTRTMPATVEDVNVLH